MTLPIASSPVPVRTTLFQLQACMALAVLLVLVPFAARAAPPNKCVVDGKVTYQQGPCASGQPRKAPSVEELNAEEKKRRASAPVTAPTSQGKQTPAASAAPAPAAALAPSSAPSGFRCDGRQYCSKMTSCAEAKFFLANCPGVKMDGNNDGIPCEQQWCGW
jgi:hypothetical protein